MSLSTGELTPVTGPTLSVYQWSAVIGAVGITSHSQSKVPELESTCIPGAGTLDLANSAI